MDNFQKLENIFNPVNLNKNLRIISLYIAVYESFKDTIVSNVKYFYSSGFENGKEIFSGYEKQVLNKVTGKKNRVLRATLKWFVDLKAITDDDCEIFFNIANMRNKLTHEMSEIIFEGIDDEVIVLFNNMIELYEKIEKWWIREIEVPISGEFSVEQYESIDWNNTSSVKLSMLKIMSDVAINENSDYLKEYTKLKDEK